MGNSKHDMLFFFKISQGKGVPCRSSSAQGGAYWVRADILLVLRGVVEYEGCEAYSFRQQVLLAMERALIPVTAKMLIDDANATEEQRQFCSGAITVICGDLCVC